MNKIISILLCFVWFTTSCNQKQEQINEIEKNVLEMLDQAMVDLKELETLENRYDQKLRLMDSLENEGISGNNFAQDRVKLIEINNKLKETNHQMTLWMNAYDGESARKLKPEKTLVYFQSEKEKIFKLKQTTEKSLTEARSFINDNHDN